MKELIGIILKIRERIQKFNNLLRQNEMLTRYVLVDPILRALGWDTEDPERVIPEVSTPQGRPDYALYYNGDNLLMVEAKSLGTDLSRVKDIGFQYCWQNRVKYFVITDGDVWELYDMRELGGREIFKIKLTQNDPGDSARKLMAIWYPAMPFIEIAPKSVAEIALQTKTKKISLKDLKQKEVSHTKLSGKIYFPDRSSASVKTWKELLVEVAKWALPSLIEQGKLPIGKLIQDTKTKMRKPENLDENWFLETWYGAKGCVRNAVRILKKANIDPATILIDGLEGV